MMSLNATSTQRLRRVFIDGFSVHDIAEPLVSFDSTASAKTVRVTMEERGYQAVGVRKNGVVMGYLEQSELFEGDCAGFTKSFDIATVIADTATFSEVIVALKERPRLFVSILGAVGGIVTRTDLQKPSVRMWLFGMVTLIEMRFSRLIEVFCPNQSWKQFLSDGRVQKAEELFEERTRRNQHIDLLACLQLSDKGQIIARNEELRDSTKFQSRRQLEQAIKGLERLRNNLAHSQDIVSSDWEIILQLSENLDEVLEGPTMLRQLDQA